MRLHHRSRLTARSAGNGTATARGVSVHHGGARRRHLLLPAWRKTVATPGPEDLRCYFLSSRSAVLSTPNISTPSQLGYFLYQE
ncbi:hypothetical protein BDA96_01G255200 [Sorghum bicolor]|uniref:Uncharacterized protein n=1 Tax=Sorghum bicolor TaxID=4558 RepID=A0A921UZU5_SORBI|nr:hypothetical protein BDA96_01G255200 [Sorghum bicolor]